ncbi:hypothetical protein B9Z55_026574 [Caenorhabditis nigoni]|nr:hypothetical protein B9Z55_026574 [Caenorhabditis nigoni]
MPILPTEAQASIRTTQETGNETLSSTSPSSSSTASPTSSSSPPLQLDLLTIAILAAAGGLLFLVLFPLMLLCLKMEIDLLEQNGGNGNRYAPLRNDARRQRLIEAEILRYNPFEIPRLPVV